MVLILDLVLASLLRWSWGGGGSDDGGGGVPAAPSRHDFFCYVLASLVWIPDSDRFLLSLGRRWLLLLRRHNDGSRLVHGLAGVEGRSVGIGEFSRTWAWIKGSWSWWLHRILLGWPDIRGATVTILWDTVLGALRHRVGHWQVVHHHDVLVGLVHGSRGLRSRTDGGAAVLDGGSWRLDLRPLKKLVMGRSRPRCKR